jgi:hypothetical protein
LSRGKLYRVHHISILRCGTSPFAKAFVWKCWDEPWTSVKVDALAIPGLKIETWGTLAFWLV